MKKLLILLVSIVLTVSSSAQNQNSSSKIRYEINIFANIKANTIYGNLQLNYVNTNPDTLYELYFLLMPNAYRKKTLLSDTRAKFGKDRLKFSTSKYRGYIDSMNFTVDSQKVDVKYFKHKQIVKLTLNKPLFPGDSVTVRTPFFLKLPEKISRLNASDSSLLLVNWYPKLAKYDSTGWHTYEYTDLNPIYSDFADYRVSVILPKDFLVIGTGDLDNRTEKKWINSLGFNGLKAKDYPNPVNNTTKKVCFTAKNVNDFILVASPNYYVLRDSIKLNGKTIQTYAFFTDKNILTWLRSVNLADSALKYLSQWFGEYPYDNFFIAQGFADNYLSSVSSNLIVISPKFSDSEMLELAVFDALSQVYTRNLLGINDYEEPVFSRGLAAYLTLRYQQLKGLGITQSELTGQTLFLIYQIARYYGFDLKNNLTLDNYDFLTYSLNLKLKAALMYNQFAGFTDYLAKTLDKPGFDSIMNAFYVQNLYRSPKLDDFRRMFDQTYGQDVTGFMFHDFIEKNKHFNYKLSINKRKIKIKSTRWTAFPVPVKLNGNGRDSTFWTMPVKKTVLKNNGFSSGTIDSSFRTTDLNRYDNFDRTGLFSRKTSYLPHFLLKINDFTSLSLNFLPAVYYRQAEGLMFGAVLHNFTLPRHRISYAVMPLYSPALKQPFGYFYSVVDLPGNGIMPDLKLSAYTDRFTILIPTVKNPPLYRNLKLSAQLTFHNPKHNDKIHKSLKLLYQRSYTPFRLWFYPDRPAVLPPEYVNIYSLTFSLKKISLYKPFSLEYALEYNYNQNLFIQYVLLRKRFHYTSVKNGLDLRLFAGQNVLLSGLTPLTDYRCQGYFLFRNLEYETNIRNPLAHQFYYTQGGFAYYSNNYLYRSLATAVATTTLPFKRFVFLKFYAAAGAGSMDSYRPALADLELFYEYGALLDFGMLKIFAPLGGSFAAQNKALAPEWYWHIRFSFDFEGNPAGIYKFIKY